MHYIQKPIVPLPVKPKGKKSAKCQYYLVDQNLEYAETEFKLSQQSFTWNRVVNWTRHHQCPIFPGEWVSQSGALKDLGNSFWVPAVKLTASLTTGALPYQKLHSIFVTLMGKKKENVYAIPSLVDTQIGTCVSTLGRCIHLHSIRHLSFCIRAFDCPMVCLVVTPEFVVFCWFCLCFFKLMITIIGGDFTRSWLSLPLSHSIKVKGGNNPLLVPSSDS